MTVLLSIITFYLLFKITNPEIDRIDSRYDAIVILSGNPERAVIGSELFFKKDAKFIYLSKEAAIVKNYINSSEERKVYEKYIDILLKNNIPRKNIILFGIDNKSTYDEAKFFSKINSPSIQNVLIVTNKFHIYRVQKMFNSFDQRVKKDFFYIDNIDDWKRDKSAVKMVFSEIIKCFLYYVYGDFNGYLAY
ncbi:YdcF family protein [Gammaproteobacteria bacterium]|nr:YdcF family protein [Gammaproteobacteria bacterium]